MPRIRTLKPEHKGHRKVGMLSDRAYRLWVGLITEADDEGRIVCDLRHFTATIFPFSSLQRIQVVRALYQIVKAGLVVPYQVRTVDYLYFPSWHDHQRIDKPRPSALPPPPIVPPQATAIRGTIHDRSSTPRDISDRIDLRIPPPTSPQDRPDDLTIAQNCPDPAQRTVAATLARLSAQLAADHPEPTA